MLEMIILWIGLTLGASTFVAFIGKKYGRGIIIGTFAGLVVTSQILANKVVVFWKFTVPAGVIVYATSFLLTDILSEFYGKKNAKEAVWSGFLASILLIITIEIAIVWPSASFWGGQEAFVKTLGLTWRIVLASLIAYLVSQNWDVFVFHKIKRITGNEHLWIRNIASTTSSQFLDTIIFISISFYGVMPIVPLIIGQYLIKLVIAVMDTPFLYSLKFLDDKL
ncbi:MAG: queuosine precursor transporter [Candidatus Aenigmatarchaeota archaeon]